MSEETDRLADLGTDEEAAEYEDTPFPLNARPVSDARKRNRERMRAKRRDPIFRAAERIKNQQRMEKKRKGALANRYGK